MLRHSTIIHVHRTLTMAGLLLVPAVQAAHAKLPSPANSTIPPCIATTPSGEFVVTFVLRGNNNDPVPNASLVLDYENCDAFVLCPYSPTDSMFHGPPTEHWVSGISDQNGVVRVRLRAGGECAEGSLRVFADGASFGTLPVAAADRNGDLVVDAADLALLQARIGETAPSADLNGDGTVDDADVLLIQAQVGATCDAQTPTRTSTWGTLEAFYR